MAYLFHYFYNLNTKCDRQKLIVYLEFTSENAWIEKIIMIHTIDETKQTSVYTLTKKKRT